MEDEVFYGSGTSIEGTQEWQAEAKRTTFGLSLTIESGPLSNRTAITIPLNIGRAQALRRVLAAALIEAGEAVE